MHSQGVLPDRLVTIHFEQGRVHGTDGCNSYTATYDTSGKSITIGQASTIFKMCAHPVGVMEQEAQYLKALGTAATYRLDGDRLELRTADVTMKACVPALMLQEDLFLDVWRNIQRFALAPDGVLI